VDKEINQVKNTTGTPDVGPVEKGNEIKGAHGGKMIFIARSAPYKKDGQDVCLVTRMVSERRQFKKKIMKQLGFTSGKQFNRWVKENKKKEAAAAAKKAAA
jgi:hypothetical protein